MNRSDMLAIWLAALPQLHGQQSCKGMVQLAKRDVEGSGLYSKSLITMPYISIQPRAMHDKEGQGTLSYE